jgi:deoxyadenosine/deoxycytidine kinase
MGHATVTIDGNIGSGKSTVLRLLSCPNVAVAPEPLEDWGAWLNRLYDPGYVTGALEFQLRVWLDRCSKRPMPTPPDARILCVERSPAFQQHVFVHANRALGHITDSGAALLHELYDTAWRPDIYVYLRTDPAACAARIAGRGRACESALSLDYLQRLHAAHEATAAHLPGAVHTIDVEGKRPEEVADAVRRSVFAGLASDCQVDDDDGRDWRALEHRLLKRGIYTQLAPWQEVPSWLEVPSDDE